MITTEDYAELVQKLRSAAPAHGKAFRETLNNSVVALDHLSAENARLREALGKIVETGTNLHHERVGDAYSDDGWVEWESVSAEAEIAISALQQGDKK